MYKLLATDMDGTLLTNAKTLTDGTIDAIKRAMAAGVKIVFASGRAWPGIEKYAKEAGINGPVITIDGTMIIDAVSGEILYDQPFEYNDVIRLLQMGHERNVTQVIWSKNKLYGTKLNELMQDYSHRYAMDMKVIKADDFEVLSRTGISKILWYEKPETVNKYVAELHSSGFESLTACTSEPYFAELFNAKASKAKALERVGKMFGIAPEEMIAVGDGENDIPMLKYAGLGVAMGNAAEKIKSEADEVTDDNEHDGVAKVIKKYFFE